MRKVLLGAVLFGTSLFTYAQQQPAKKPLDHSVYDNWQSIGTKVISANGQFVAYAVLPQEGDANLIIHDLKSGQSVTIPRGTNPVMSKDSRFLICTIKPLFKDTRDARIKKKKPAEMPKDSLAIIAMGQSAEPIKIPAVKSFKIPESTLTTVSLVAWLQEMPADSSKKDNKIAKNTKKDNDREDDDKAAGSGSENGMLIVRQLVSGKQDTIKNASEYVFNKDGQYLLVETTINKKDSLSTSSLIRWNIAKSKADTLSKGQTDYKQLAISTKGELAAFLATSDSSKAQQQFYKLYYFDSKSDSAKIVADKNSNGIPANWTISPNATLTFSNDGKRLFFGTAPILPVKDTNIVDFEVAKVDIWNYKDDYLQPMQLKNADKELKKSFAAVYHPGSNRVIQLGNDDVETVVFTKEDSPYALGYSDKGERVALQWTGRTLKTAYLINVNDGTRKKIQEKLNGNYYLSPFGKYIIWYDLDKRNWFSYQNATGLTANISDKIPTKMFDEEDDHPDVPEAYGIATWLHNDDKVFIYDRYDIWSVDPAGKQAPVNYTDGIGRKEKITFRYIQLDKEYKYVLYGSPMVLSAYQETSKYNGFYLQPGVRKDGKKPALKQLVLGPWSFTDLQRSSTNQVYVFNKGRYDVSPDVFTATDDFNKATQLSHTNPQQKEYNWGTAELYKWTTFSGKHAEGILYKPENFDSTKKYPVIFYFYEKLTDGLYNYQAPAPTPSRLNISFFVSRGYLVFAPDITYENGYPGKSAYDYIVSAAEDMAKKSWVDGKHMGIQGQSWGGYQVAYLITQTNLFAAAWAGAPVANMTSAYGGIRWESGMNRQFQYEHSQSRIGATLWEKPELYIENSPLFNLPKVSTPLAIMANDADGAVPWYQGIELFTGLRRLGKPVWMLNYNNEAHNLIQRQNRKDIQRREQQFFDHLLKGAPAPQWMVNGVPATEKGINWGWELVP
ncbi:S9 family peptidase [Chitinophaga silvatica]|uniref:S9 family peptidase n=1 Tax=Chitinophaga silvatica TaxID=2282649 RepID=A0A3E1YFG1_9BACT|nr:prolyl oligopeptidase family serine peptidase [Chitinophaga silvatica]RFS25057.1 S9 family peptidase [Chitinophaga silvatica]